MMQRLSLIRLARIVSGISLVWVLTSLQTLAGAPMPEVSDEADSEASNAVILQYHHVAENTPAITSIRPELFARHLRYLEENDYQVLPLLELINRIRNGDPVPERSVAITFDDAYANVYTNAFPLLRQRDWPFTVFVNSEPIDQGFGDHSSWEQLREMGAAGATLANHSHTHAHLGARRQGESEADWLRRVRRDIEQAQQRIRDETGQDHPLFAYPYGEFTPALQQLVEKLGMVGIGQHSGPIGPLSDFTALPRFPMAADYAKIPQLREKLNTRPLPVKKLRRPDNPLAPGTRPSVEMRLSHALERAGDLKCYASGQGEIALQWLDDQRFKTRAERPLPAGRSRYNCTAPAPKGGFYWYSVPWVSLDAQQRWPQD